MKRLSEQEALEEAISTLQKGGVLIHATETCYGLTCDATNADAVKKLFEIKKRPLTQPVSILFSSIDDAEKYTEWDTHARELGKELPGPLTLIVPVKDGANIFTTPRGNDGSAGVRISSYPFAQTLVETFGRPIVTTSANLHGGENPYDAIKLEAIYEKETIQPDLIIDGGTLPRNPPSKIIDTREGGEKIVRL